MAKVLDDGQREIALGLARLAQGLEHLVRIRAATLEALEYGRGDPPAEVIARWRLIYEGALAWSDDSAQRMSEITDLLT